MRFSDVRTAFYLYVWVWKQTTYFVKSILFFKPNYFYMRLEPPSLVPCFVSLDSGDILSPFLIVLSIVTQTLDLLLTLWRFVFSLSHTLVLPHAPSTTRFVNRFNSFYLYTVQRHVDSTFYFLPSPSSLTSSFLLKWVPFWNTKFFSSNI